MASILHHNLVMCGLSSQEISRYSKASHPAKSYSRPCIRTREALVGQRSLLVLSRLGSRSAAKISHIPGHGRILRSWDDLRRLELRQGGCACLFDELSDVLGLRDQKKGRHWTMMISAVNYRTSSHVKNAFCTDSPVKASKSRGGARSRRWRVLNSESSALVSQNEGLGRRPLKMQLCSDGVRPASLAAPDNDLLLPKDMRRQPGSTYRKKLVVGVDVDEVLGAFVATLNAFCEEEYRKCYDISEYHIYDFKSVWGCSQEEANHRVHAFFKSRHFNQGIPPIPGAMHALLRLQLHCNLVVVTSRQHVIRQPTLEWIETHYPKVFEEVHFGNHYALEGVARAKSDICKSLGVEVLIDDNPKYAMECAQHGIEVLLFDWNDSYPWSKTPDGPVHPLITRVLDWTEVEHVLSARILALEP